MNRFGWVKDGISMGIPFNGLVVWKRHSIGMWIPAQHKEAA